MKHSMMRVAVAATLGLSALAANAGQIGVNVGATLAAESVTAAVLVKQPTITYQTASLINDGAAVQVHVRFSAGSTLAADGGVMPLSAKTFAGAVADVALFLNGSPVTATNYSVSASTADTDGLGYYFTVTNLAGSGGFSAGTVVNVLTGNAKIALLTTALGAGGTVSATVGYTTTAGDFSGVATFVEPLVSATLLTSKKALSQVVGDSATSTTYVTNETAQVDVGTSLTTFTGAGPTAGTPLINLGTTKLKLDGTLTNAVTGVAIVAADIGTTVFKATGDFSAAGTVFLASNETCVTSVAAGTLSADKKTATFAAEAAAVALANNFLCYSVAVAPAKTIAYNVQYAISAAATAAGANSIASTGTAGNAYFLKSNGASVVVPSFVPTTGALGAGYNTYLRVINTGNLTADINVSAYNPTTGVAGTASKLASALPAGGSVVLSTDAVSAALGLTTGTWYSLLVTGSTSRLAVQPLLVNPQGVITNIGSVNGANNSAASN